MRLISNRCGAAGGSPQFVSADWTQSVTNAVRADLLGFRRVSRLDQGLLYLDEPSTPFNDRATA